MFDSLSYIIWSGVNALAPLPGLRGVTYVSREPISFIVDTRGLTMAGRGMDRATAMGLDITRADYLDALNAAATQVPEEGVAVLVYKCGDE